MFHDIFFRSRFIEDQTSNIVTTLMTNIELRIVDEWAVYKKYYDIQIVPDHYVKTLMNLTLVSLHEPPKSSMRIDTHITVRSIRYIMTHNEFFRQITSTLYKRISFKRNIHPYITLQLRSLANLSFKMLADTSLSTKTSHLVLLYTFYIQISCRV